ncbi:hypothetical protein AB0C40_23865 [Streptomyces brevispora]|uniref:hypothetical protein n=1 Tax=Streptomyces brevispora TaxID=887462 RepID=UPI00340C27DB
MAGQVRPLFHAGSAESSPATWSRDESSCGTDDLAGGARFVGAAAVAVPAPMSRR